MGARIGRGAVAVVAAAAAAASGSNPVNLPFVAGLSDMTEAPT